jgi:hypothetical protein
MKLRPGKVGDWRTPLVIQWAVDKCKPIARIFKDYLRLPRWRKREQAMRALPDKSLVYNRRSLARRAIYAGALSSMFIGINSAANADQNFTSFTYPVTGGSVSRTTPDRFADVVNVKEYGATGNGITDDRAAIVTALAAAFGPVNNPNGHGNPFINKPVYFPPGNYVVKNVIYLTNILGGQIFGGGPGATQIFFQGTGAEGNSTFTDFPNFTPVFMCDGVSHTTFEGMTIACDHTTAPTTVTLTTNATTAAGNNTLHFASVPASIHVNMAAYDATAFKTAGSTELLGLYVVSTTSTTVVLSGNVPAPGVGNGDTIHFVTSVVGICQFQSGLNNGTSANVFRSMNFNELGLGMFAGGVTTANCENCSLYDIEFQKCAYAALRVLGSNTLNWAIYDGGCSECGSVSTFISGQSSGNGSAALSITTGGVQAVINWSVSGGIPGTDFYHAGTQTLNVYGGRSETLNPCIIITNAKFDGWEWGLTTSTGCCAFDLSFGGQCSLYACFISPAVSGGTPFLAKLGNSGQLRCEDTLWGSNSVQLVLSGSAGSRIWFSGMFVPFAAGALTPVAATLFGASFTGLVMEYSPFFNTTVGALPTAAAKYAGCRGSVTDANATTYASNVAASGTNLVNVYCGTADGSTYNWKIG